MIINLRARWLKAVGIVAAAVIVIIAAGVVWRLVDRDPEVSAADVPSRPELVARGRYLAQAADCTACHTTPGGELFTGGLAFALPFGTIYSSNITPDRETGIGTWSDNDFVRALHQGIAKDGSHLYPAFPYTSYTALSRDDAVAIKAYLFSLLPKHAPARENGLAFPFNQRWGMAFWNLVFLDQHRFRPNLAASAEENRGAYLATALGHCGECHTPRNLAFAMEQNRQFAGTTVNGWRAYNITSDKTYGVGGWSDRQLADYLQTGHADGRGSAAGPMGEAVANSLQYLTSQDTAALVSYLRKVPPQTGEPGEIAATTPGMKASTAWAPGQAENDGNVLGFRIFAGACASCHQWNGAGQQTQYAALGGDQAVNDPTGANLVQVLLAGADLRAVHPTTFMPSFGKAYTDAELAAVSNFVIDHFGGKTGRVTAEAVRQGRDGR